MTATRVVRIDPAAAVRLRGPFLDPARAELPYPVGPRGHNGGPTRFVLEEGIRLTPTEFFTQAVGDLVEAGAHGGDGWNRLRTRMEIKVNDD